MITRVLHKVGYVGRIGFVTVRRITTPIYALVVPFEHAFEELALNFHRKDWGIVSREEFSTALRRDDIQLYDARSEDAAKSKRWKDRQRKRELRSA